MLIDLETPVLPLGRYVLDFGGLLIGAGVGALLLLAVLAWLVWRGTRTSRRAARDNARRQADMETQLYAFMQAQGEMTGRLKAMSEAVASRQSELSRGLNERLDQVGHKLGQNLEQNTRRTSESLSRLNERLAVIDTAQKNLTDLSGQMVSLQDILSNKQARGAFGQGRMEAIIMDGLPKGAFDFQPTLSNGTRPDCVIRLPNTDAGIVIDAKFPLEAFNAFRDNQSPAERSAAMTRVRNDINRHVSDIASKYLIAGETQETAMMFVPSEAIYAELHDNFEDVVQKAYRSRVVIVSPNMMMLAVQTIQAILKDVRMREQASIIQNEVHQMMDDVHRLRDRVLNLQRHFGQANDDIEKILISSDKVSKRGLRIEQLDFDDDSQKPARKVRKSSPKPKLAAGE